jgi:acetolactate synthase-1/2/3 large subunit
MRVAYYINDRLLQLPIRHVYFLPFGGVMHLNEALGVNPLLEPVVCLHEQTSGIASHVFGKLINSPSASLVISGLRSTME